MQISEWMEKKCKVRDDPLKKEQWIFMAKSYKALAKAFLEKSPEENVPHSMKCTL